MLVQKTKEQLRLNTLRYTGLYIIGDVIMTSLHHCRVSPEKLLTVNGANAGIKLGNFQLVAVLDRNIVIIYVI